MFIKGVFLYSIREKKLIPPPVAETSGRCGVSDLAYSVVISRIRGPFPFENGSFSWVGLL